MEEVEETDAAPASMHHSTASAWSPGFHNELGHLQAVVEDEDPAPQSWSATGIEHPFRYTSNQ